METKQSSIEWLEDKLNNVKPTEFCSIETIKKWVEQAKEMHKQEIIEAFSLGDNQQGFENEGLDYYNETFVAQK